MVFTLPPPLLLPVFFVGRWNDTIQWCREGTDKPWISVERDAPPPPTIFYHFMWYLVSSFWFGNFQVWSNLWYLIFDMCYMILNLWYFIYAFLLVITVMISGYLYLINYLWSIISNRLYLIFHLWYSISNNVSLVILPVIFGLWSLIFDPWCLILNVWSLVFDIFSFDIWHLVFGMWLLIFNVWSLIATLLFLILSLWPWISDFHLVLVVCSLSYLMSNIISNYLIPIVRCLIFDLRFFIFNIS